MTVIGAGPVGMCTAFWAGMREISSRVIDSLPELGSRLATPNSGVPGVFAGQP